MEVEMNLIQKLASIRSYAKVVRKNKNGFNYKYADITDILAKVTTGMEKYNVSLIPSIVPGTAFVERSTICKTKTTKNGQVYEEKKPESLVCAQMNFRWINNENPDEFLDIPWFLTGSQEDPSQGFGSAITYCTRYFLTSYFQIAQPETDADAYIAKRREAEAQQDAEIAAEITTHTTELITSFLADNKDKRDEVLAVVSKYSKSGDPRKIKDPILASKLLDDIKTTFKLED